ncbi:MAG: Stp1/IreP family PP2C-type Ser/Thr phosphatase [Bacillota bacterium]
MLASVASDVGRVREANEDYYCLCQLMTGCRPVLMAVADGMGGFEAGEVASRLAVEETRRWLEVHAGGGEDLQCALATACAAANERVYRVALDTFGYSGMGTTLTAALWAADRLVLAHVGDSRAYLVRKGRLQRLTADHSVVGAMVQNGELGEREAMRHPQRNLLTKALGTEPRLNIDIAEHAVCDGDIIVMCTDGLTNLVASEEILEAINGCRDLAGLGDQLVEMANARGGNDNITVLVAGIGRAGGGDGV